jgi:hypothetical protein
MLAIFLIAAATSTEPPTMPAFMTGCWELHQPTDRSWTQECWMEPKAGLMLGASREGVEEKLRSWEQMRIELARDGKLTFFGSPHGRPAVAFEARTTSTTAVEFTNAKHDYPQRIRYELKDGKLNAEISLLDGTKAVQWSYVRENP